jgi:hypothetical protein
MIDGLWSLQYHGPQGNGGGVVVFTGDKARGGDSGYTYIGTFKIVGETMMADVEVANFDNTIRNVLGVPGNFHLLIQGKVSENEIKCVGSLADMPDSKIIIVMTRRDGR